MDKVNPHFIQLADLSYKKGDIIRDCYSKSVVLKVYKDNWFKKISRQVGKKTNIHLFKTRVNVIKVKWIKIN